MISQIIEDIIDDIEFGIYDESTPLPSENYLASEYGVSRYDIRRVYERLFDMGYIVTSPGVGRFVRNKQKKISIELSGNKSFTEKMHIQKRDLVTKFIDVSIVQGARDIFGELDAYGADIVRLSRVRIIDGEEAAIHTSYISTAIFEDILECSQSITSMFSYYQSKGYTEFNYEGSILHAVLPSDSEREILNCPSLVPVMVLETKCYDKASGKLIEISRIIYRGDRFNYHIK